MNAISVALKGKGASNLLRRGLSIVRRYGITSQRLDQALAHLISLLNRFECSATFPITAVALHRHPRVIKTYHEQGIEFAIHGYRHIDHSLLSLPEQLAQLRMAKKVFEIAGIQLNGFRGPYLHATSDTLEALRQLDLAYDSSRALSWDVVNDSETPAYRHVLAFYGAVPANDFLSLPSLEGDLVRIPYSLPDDEGLIHRLLLHSTDRMEIPWLKILQRSYELGELFTLGLHPERAFLCQGPLVAVLSEARQLYPKVWIARLDEIAAWWRQRSETAIALVKAADDRWQVTVQGPPGVTILARDVYVSAPTRPWADGYQRVDVHSFTAHADTCPIVGIPPGSSNRLVSFLRQQGYVVEVADGDRSYTVHLDRTDLAEHEERKLLARLEKEQGPLVRLGRWPDGARSALSVTGDIDALTLWDYGLRFLGR